MLSGGGGGSLLEIIALPESSGRWRKKINC
jgi:hypothetical protein